MSQKDPAAASTRPLRELLRKEYELLSRLSHRNIVIVHSFEDLPGHGPTILMDWIDGAPIDRYLASGKATRADRERLSRQLADDVAYIHDSNITHRDLKPSNLLVDNLGNLVIIDFGLADDPASCMLKRVTGTAGFAAPEFSEAAPDTDWRRSDVYALGLMLRAIDASRTWRRTGNRCMKNNPADRPADGAAVKALYRRLHRQTHMALAAILVLVLAAATFLLIPKRQATIPQNSEELKASVIAGETDSVPEAVDNPAESKEIVPVDQPEESKAKPAVSKPRTAPDVNFALLRAMDIRDSLLQKAEASGTGTYDRNELDRLTDRILDLGKNAGWRAAEYAFARRELRSEPFYAGKHPRFYSSADTLSTVTP